MPSQPILPPSCIESRRHENGTDFAVFSPDRAYRYELTRRWGLGPRLLWICLNPSTADAMTDDPTVRRIRAFTRRFSPSSGGLRIVNLYALRATDPAALWRHNNPIGPAGDDMLHGAALASARNDMPVIAAWGTHGARNDRGVRVAAELAAAGVRLLCLGTTKDGHPRHPRHPLYLAGDTALEPFAVKAVAHV